MMFCNPFGRRKPIALEGDEESLHPEGKAEGCEGPDPFNLGPLALRQPVQAATNPTGEQVGLLRRELNKAKLDWYIIFSDDSHASETPALCDRRRAFITGFTGSAGTAILGAHSAHLFTDGRYWIQAGQQLDENWTLHKVGAPAVDNWLDFLIKTIKPSQRVGFDATTIASAAAKDLIAKVEQAGGRVHIPNKNLVDLVWTSRPPPRKTPIYEHKLEYAGEKASDKLVKLSKHCLELVEAERAKRKDPHFGVDGSTYVVTALDEIAWLLNLRGDSVPYTPVFPGYVTVANVLQPGQLVPDLLVTLYTDWDLVPRPTLDYLTSFGVHVARYESIWTVLKEPYAEHHVLLAAPQASYAITQAWRGDEANVLVLSPADNWIAQTKAVKNAAELDGMRRSYRRDGAAWVRWVAHLEAELQSGVKVNEWGAAERLMKAREHPLYRGEAYSPISATAGNAALPHYGPTPEVSEIIDPRTPYLCDAGGQYADGGTIDTTRTMFFNVRGTRPSEEHKRAFTRVLQGHIAIDTARFPEGTPGSQLDALARQPLFQDGYSYTHGTGHGIGSFLGVHEGPHGFGAGLTTPFKIGNVVSNEPGFYEEGQFGVRIESVLEVVEAHTHRQFGGVRWLEFARLTVVPIDKQLVDFSLLSPNEKAWLESHNQTCKAKLLPLVKDDPLAVRWLQRQ